MARRNYTFDANMILDDGGSPHSAGSWGQVAGAQSIVDLGGNQGITITLPSISNVPTITPQQARGDFACVIYDVAATLSGSNVYRLNVVGSNNPGMLSGNVILGAAVIGQGAGMDPPNSANSPAPLGAGNYPSGWQYEVLFTNEQANVPYQFVSLWVAGTFGSITFNAFVAVLPRE
jgi:hypothetical protein